MTTQFQQTAWAQLLIGTIVRAGVRHAVVSPGSRSTPFLMALLREDAVRLHPIIDERSAGFVGIGIARASASPVLLLCTSGTAAANYLPAIVEANIAGIPLVVLTADRPVEAQEARSPQTIDQNRLYGNNVRSFFDLGEAPTNTTALRGIRRLVSTAVRTATGPNPGPVHLNARARKPLHACEPSSDEERLLHELVISLLQDCPEEIMGESSPNPELLAGITAACTQKRRGLIVCGFDAGRPPLEPEALAHFARATGYPVWLDVSHPLRWSSTSYLLEQTIHCADLLWGCDRFATQFRPDLLIQLGPIPTSAVWESWLELVGAQKHIVFARHGCPDPSGRADLIVTGELSKTLGACTQVIEVQRGRKVPEMPWFLDWRAVDTRAEFALEAWLLANEPWGELQALRAAVESCPRGTRVVIGNSLPVREADLVAPASDRGLQSFAVRGANGIDGILSIAAGVALGGTGPTLVLLGDVSFAHDMGALYAVRDIQNPLAIVVLDNRGGRIFEQLPIHAITTPDELDYWTTPHDLNLAAAGSIYGIETQRPNDLRAIRLNTRDALKRPGATLIVIGIDPHSPRRDAKSLRDAIACAIFDPKFTLNLAT